MSDSYFAKAQITIVSDPATLWQAITGPYQAKLKVVDGEAEPWQVTSSLVFKGYWEEGEYEDKGVIVELQPERVFTYSIWSRFSGRLDLPENYDTITYDLRAVEQGTELIITQDNYPTQSAATEGSQSWAGVCASIKIMIENIITR